MKLDLIGIERVCGYLIQTDSKPVFFSQNLESVQKEVDKLKKISDSEILVYEIESNGRLFLIDSNKF